MENKIYIIIAITIVAIGLVALYGIGNIEDDVDAKDIGTALMPLPPQNGNLGGAEVFVDGTGAHVVKMNSTHHATGVSPV